MSEDYNKGIEGGVDNLDKSIYEDYVSSELNAQFLEEQKAKVDAEIESTRTLIDNTEQEKRNLLKTQQELKYKHDTAQYDVQVLENQLNALETKVADTRLEKEKNPLHYPLLAGIIYFAAGIVFMAGDLIISHEIVAYALNIKNNTEAWAFACGLAGVTLLLKPAYERIIEQPYLNNPTERNQKIHRWFQGVLVIASIGTLGILGFFRYEAYRVDKLKENINADINSLQLSTTPLIQGAEVVENPNVTRQIEAKLKELNDLNTQLVDSPWALLSFVLSGVLFAVAGAICFGMAFPILSSYWKRWIWHNPSINKSNRQMKKIQVQLSEVKKPWFEYASQLDYTRECISLLPSIEQLKQELRQLQDKSLELAEKLRLAKESTRVQSYNSGYNRGEVAKAYFSPEELKHFRVGNLDKLKQEELDNTPKVYRNNGLRPYQALRKAISTSFNEN